jgi:enoyl-CoA hydratase
VISAVEISKAVEFTSADGVALIRMRSTVARMPNLSAPTVAGLVSALDWVDREPRVRCAVLSGSDGGFALGADVKALAAMSPADAHAYNATVVALVDRIDRCRVPVIAAIAGHAYGGGLEIAMACSMRIAANDARMGLPEVHFGLVPACGGLPRLLRLVGPGVAADLVLSGRIVDADEALRLRLVEVVVAPEDLLEVAQARAAAVSSAAPRAVEAMKAALRAVDGLGVAEGAEHVHEVVGGLLADPETRDRIAAYVERRPRAQAAAAEGRDPAA